MFAMSAPGIQVVSLWTHLVPDQQVKAVVFFDIEAVVDDCVVVWAFSSAKVVDNSVSVIQLIVNRNPVITSGFFSSCNEFVFLYPLQTTRVLVSEFQKFFDDPERGHLPVNP